jgi:hypothetical protein
MGFAVKLACLSALGALVAAPAALAQVYGPPPGYQTYAHPMTNGTRNGGITRGYDESLGASERGIPPNAQAQAGAVSQPNPYEQWNYTGWNGLTKHGRSSQLNTRWSSNNPEHYIQANPPPR